MDSIALDIYDLSRAPVSNRVLALINPRRGVYTCPSWMTVTFLSRMLSATLARYLSTLGMTPWHELTPVAHEQYILDGSSNVGISSTFRQKFPIAFVASTDTGSIDASPTREDSRSDHCTNFFTS